MSNRYDERHTMFSRMFELEEGSVNYKKYYSEYPESEAADRKLRKASYGVFSDRLIEQKQVDAVFSLIADFRVFAGHDPDKNDNGNLGDDKKLEIEPDDAAARVKKAAASLGAFSCGISDTNLDWVYSVRGRGVHYGNEVNDVLPHTIVFAVEMDETEINRAPAVEQSVEVSKSYLQAAVIGLALKRVINAWGFNAVCHMDGESQIILAPAAVDSGLGSIGLNAVLVTKDCGPRVRLAAVTTDLPLSKDSLSNFNIRNFCKTCGKCAESCPSLSIKTYDSYKEGERFSINHESCFGMWRDLATDCGVCLAVCPFSHPLSKNRGADINV